MDHNTTLAIINMIARGDSANTYRVAIVTESGIFEGDITTREGYLLGLAQFAWPNSNLRLRTQVVDELGTTASYEERTYVNNSHDAQRVLKNLILSEIDPDVSFAELQIESLDRWKSERIYLSRVSGGGLPTSNGEHAVIMFDIDEIASWYALHAVEVADVDNNNATP